MNKLYIAALSTIFALQQTQCMENKQLTTTTPSDDKHGYTIIKKDLNDLPKPIRIIKERNEFSEQLYKENITDTEIRDLVKKGAELNYQKQGWSSPLAIYYATINTPQGRKNMQTIIELGVALHNLEDTAHTPLTIVLQRDKHLPEIHKDSDFSEMIQLLIKHENPVVTVYNHDYYDKNGEWCRGESNSTEEKIREYLISHICCYPKVSTIKLMLNLKLMTAQRGLKEFAHFMKPNQEIIDFFRSCGAHDMSESLPKVMEKAFPNIQYIEFLRQICANKAFDKETLKQMLVIKKFVDGIVADLESSQSIDFHSIM